MPRERNSDKVGAAAQYVQTQPGTYAALVYLRVMEFLEFPTVIPLVIALVTFAVAFVLRVMAPRRFYIVRHGETLKNAADIYQDDKGGLSDRGKAQAERVGEFLSGLHITRIVASPFERAQETAKIIQKHVHARITYSKLLRERRNPTEVVGQSVHDPKIAHIVDLIEHAYHDDAYRYSDEETFEEMRARGLKALAYLTRSISRTTCVVTHHKFLKMLVAAMLYRKHLHASDYVKLSFFNPSGNANLTICEYHPWRQFSKTRGWEVIDYDATPS